MVIDIKAKVSTAINIVAARKQKKADLDGDVLFLLPVEAILTIFNTAVMMPPMAWPWNKDPMYSAGNNPASPANEPWV